MIEGTLRGCEFKSFSAIAAESGLSGSQVNRILAKSPHVRRSLDSRGQYIAPLEVVEARATKAGVAFIEEHAFSTEPNMVSALLKAIRESKSGRYRKSLEQMFRCINLSKSFKKLEACEDIIRVHRGNDYCYLDKDRADEQCTAYFRRRGHTLTRKDRECITYALVFSHLDYGDLSALEARTRKNRSGGGRRPFPFKAMLNGICYRIMNRGITSYEKLALDLENNAEIASVLGFDVQNQGTPSASTFSRFVQDVGGHRKNNVDEALAQALQGKKELKQKSNRKKLKNKPPQTRLFTKLDNLESEIQALEDEISQQQQELDDLEQNGWYCIFMRLVEQLIHMAIIDGKLVCLDSTHVYSKRKDTNGSYGVKRSERRADGTVRIIKDFVGYKLHIAVDARTHLPIAVTVTTGCVADNKEAIPIIRQLKKHGIFFGALLADGAYNDRKIYREVKNHSEDAKFICRANEHEDEAPREYYYDEETGERHTIHYNTEPGRRLYTLRGPSENINKIIKDDLGLEKLQVAGINAVRTLAYLHCIAVLLLAIAATTTGRRHLINRFSRLV